MNPRRQSAISHNSEIHHLVSLYAKSSAGGLDKVSDSDPSSSINKIINEAQRRSGTKESEISSPYLKLPKSDSLLSL